MEETMLIQITDRKAIKHLHALEEQHLIKVIKEPVFMGKQKFSEKYKNVFSKKDAESFDKHTQNLRNEWPNT